MFGSLGAPELILIFIVALLVFGPRRLPEIGRTIGGLLRDLRRATGDFRSSVEREIGFDPSEKLEAARRARRDVLSVVSDPLKDAAEGAMSAVRDVREAVILPPGRAPGGSLPHGSHPGGRGPAVAPTEGRPPDVADTSAAPSDGGSSDSADTSAGRAAGPAPSTPPPDRGEPLE